MRRTLLILILLAVVGYVIWRFVIVPKQETVQPTQSNTTSLDKDEVFYDEALQDLQDAKETLPTR